MAIVAQWQSTSGHNHCTRLNSQQFLPCVSMFESNYLWFGDYAIITLITYLALATCEDQS